MRRTILSIFATTFLLTLFTATGHSQPANQWDRLSAREKTFLRFLLTGDDAKAVQYVQVAGINVNSIAGFPLSSWFYRLSPPLGVLPPQRSPRIQNLVFGTFRQNPNPPLMGELREYPNFCDYGPLPDDLRMRISGTPEQKRILQEMREEAYKRNINGMAEAFDSLLRYGLTNRQIINQMFIGCVFAGAVPLGEGTYNYDILLKRMLKAGANINAESVGGSRAVQIAVQRLNPDLLERLLRDGAQVNYPLRMSGFDHPTAGERCSPRLSRSLYAIAVKNEWVRVRNPEPIVRIIKLLAAKGLSPMTPLGNEVQFGRCEYKSFYDKVVDSGNLQLATAIKEAVGTAQAAATVPAATAPQAQSTPPARPALPVAAQTFGHWRVAANADGRPIAVAPAADGDLREMRVECVPGGRLEYVPVATNGQPVALIYVPAINDHWVPVNLSRGRAAGAAAVRFSKEFLNTEAAANAGGEKDWMMEFAVGDWQKDPSHIKANGFSTMRAYMLANCK